MANTYIAHNSRDLPEVWTNDLCVELFDHARNLGHNGNPSGYFLTLFLHPYVGYDDKKDIPHIKLWDEWDYDGIRAWIDENSEKVKRVWQFEVRSLY